MYTNNNSKFLSFKTREFYNVRASILVATKKTRTIQQNEVQSKCMYKKNVLH